MLEKYLVDHMCQSYIYIYIYRKLDFRVIFDGINLHWTQYELEHVRYSWG